MQIQLDLRSGVPIYVQIMDQIKHFIATGVLRPDDQLPTVRQLASELRVNFNTVARAYRSLDEAGIISTQHGRGTYVLAPVSREASEKIRQEAIVGLTRHFLAKAAQLGFTPQEINEILQQQLQEWQSSGAAPELDQD